MPPAFSSTKQAAGFVSLLLFLLAAPWLAHKTFLPQREQTYSSQSIRWEKYPWAQKFIFQETNDIDIAFIGSSHMIMGIDTRYVQEKLSEKLGHETVVRSVCFLYSGFDGLYAVTKDLLAHRRVKTLVFYDEFPLARFHIEFHRPAPLWFRYGEDGGVSSGLPFGYQAVYYYAAMIGIPRNLLELFVSNLPPDPQSQLSGPFAQWHAANPEMTLGCIGAHVGFDPTYEDHFYTNFNLFVPHNGVTPADVCVYNPATASNFMFSDRPLPVAAVYYAKQFGLLTKKYGCNLVALHLPWYEERTSSVIKESRKWPDLMQTDVCMMGIPEARLFAGLSEFEKTQLYYDPGHMNLNGQKYFTPLVTPALIQFYENHSRH
jgi:hypothetical protein